MIKPQVFICVGAGGVGKTSVSAMLGLEHAHEGKKVLVITIDPARRLLDALGLNDQKGIPARLKLKGLKGEFYALMPDLEKEWMDFLKAAVEDNQNKIHNISRNHFYRYMVEGFPGSLEIICCHILYRLIEARHYDVIILDTPPSNNSLSFFEVPQKLAAVFERSVFQMLMQRRNSFFFKLSKRLAFFSSSILHKTLEKIVGSHFLSEVIDFALSIDALYEPLYSRTRAMERLLLDHNTRWTLVLRPTSSSVDDSIRFGESLSQKGIVLHQLILNQVMPSFAIEKTLRCSPIITELVLDYERQCTYEQSLINKLMNSFKKSDCRKLSLLANDNTPIGLLEGMLKDYQKDII